MNNNKVQSRRTVLPFSWESKPGVSKDGNDDNLLGGGGGGGGDFPVIKLPPPPCPKEKSNQASFDHDLQIPPPPCASFQKPLRSNSARRSFRKNIDDPFLIAYIECTKSARDDHKWSGVISKRDGGFGIKKNLSLFSCKHSSNVIDDSIVRVSQFPTSKSQRLFQKED